MSYLDIFFSEKIHLFAKLILVLPKIFHYPDISSQTRETRFQFYHQELTANAHNLCLIQLIKSVLVTVHFENQILNQMFSRDFVQFLDH
jgi:hypothetical protein